jgi:RNA polymerase sigma-70 factor (ECF subfamily)
VTDSAASGSSRVSLKAAKEAAWRNYLGCMATGDQLALAALYDESSQLVYSVALRLLGDVADAEEVTMDVYTQVWRNAAAYDDSRGSVAGWLITLARSRAIDRVRSRRGRLQNETALPETFDLPSQGTSPERQSEETQRRQRVIAALETLPAEQREVLRLAFFGGLTHSELAARLQQPLGTIKTRLRAGMMKLRGQLTPLSA